MSCGRDLAMQGPVNGRICRLVYIREHISTSCVMVSGVGAAIKAATIVASTVQRTAATATELTRNEDGKQVD